MSGASTKVEASGRVDRTTTGKTLRKGIFKEQAEKEHGNGGDSVEPEGSQEGVCVTCLSLRH
jgi:hypothetical protein